MEKILEQLIEITRILATQADQFKAVNGLIALQQEQIIILKARLEKIETHSPTT